MANCTKNCTIYEHFKHLYRYSIDDGQGGGGLVVADSVEDGKIKVYKNYSEQPGFDYSIDDIVVWLWEDDDHYDSADKHILDMY